MSERWYLEFNDKLNKEHLQRIQNNRNASIGTTQAILDSKNAQLNNLRKDHEASTAAINNSYLESQKTILALESDQAARHETSMQAICQAHTTQMKEIEQINQGSEGGQLLQQLIGGGIGYALGGPIGAAAGLAITGNSKKNS